MNDRTIEVIIMLLGHLRENDLDVESLKEFSESLVIHGYNEHDVAEAIGWLFEKLNFMTVSSTEIAVQKDQSVRILHSYERMKISPEVYGYLLKLKNLSIINGSQMEKIIDYCMLTGDEVDESDIDEIMATILFQEQE
ncbi:MAG: DUF494 family protein [Candidatus Latescibacteria bacterium]|nr:DUF494 family protein [Candidatus Latescibacterota bacterium]